jgi:hypothetical protein
MTEKVEKRITKPVTIEMAEYNRSIWVVKPTIETEVEDLLDHNYWAHIAKRLKPGDRIEALPEDRHYFAEFIVIACASNWAKIKLLRSVVLIEDNDKTEIDGYTIKWAGPRDRFRVMAGDEIISKGHGDKESAMQALNDHMKIVK